MSHLYDATNYCIYDCVNIGIFTQRAGHAADAECGQERHHQGQAPQVGRDLRLVQAAVPVPVRQLAQLDDRLLRDIGLDRGTARFEATKGFWS